MLYRGAGVEKSEEEALGWCHKAAERGLPEAQLMLGDLLTAGAGTEADPATARVWYEKAAAQGLAAASTRLASA
jgi:TPR repeat protein